MSCLGSLRIPLFSSAAVGIRVFSNSNKQGGYCLAIWTSNYLYIYSCAIKPKSTVGDDSFSASFERPALENCQIHDFVLEESCVVSSAIITVLSVSSILYCGTKNGFVQIEIESKGMPSECEQGTLKNAASKLVEEENSQSANFVVKRTNVVSACSFKDGAVMCYYNDIVLSWIIEAFQNIGGKIWRTIFQTSAQYSINDASSKQDLDSDDEELFFDDIKPKPVIQCFEIESVDFECANNVLKKDFFALLFGKSAFFDRNKAIVAGLPDGRVLWWPTIETKTKTPLHRILWHLDQPTVAIFKNSFGSPENKKECIILVGRYGKVIAIYDGSRSSKEHLQQGPSLEYIESCISHPVRACRSCGIGWFHVTDDGSLWRNELAVDETLKKLRIESRASGFGDVADISVTSDLPESVRTAAILLCDGVVAFKRWNASSSDSSSLNSGDGRRSLKELTKDICRCSEKMQITQNFLTEQSELMKQLNIMANLMFSKPALEIQVMHTLDELSSKDGSHVLSINMDSIKSLDLNADWWYFVVTVSSVNKGSVVLVKTISASQGFFPLLVPLKLRLHSNSEDGFSLPLRVECGLQISAPSDLAVFKSVPALPKPSNAYVVLKIFDVDSLDVTCEATRKSLLLERRKKSRLDAASNFSRKRTALNLIKMHFEDAAPFVQEMSTTVTVADKAFCLAKDVQAHNLRIAVLNLLTSRDSRENSVLAACRSDNVSKMHFGEPVSLSVEHNSPFLQIAMRSKSIASLCSLRKAAIERIRQRTENAELRAEDPLFISKKSLEALQLLKHRLRSMSEDQETLTRREIANLYLQLRNTISSNFPLL